MTIKIKNTYFNYIRRFGRMAVLFCMINLLFAGGMSAFGQSSSRVNGTIKNRQGEPLRGVKVSIKNTAISTSSNPNGNFTLNLLDETAVITFNHLGFAEEERTVKNGDKLEIIMMEVAQDLEQVVVVGYGTQKRGDVTAAISSIDAKTIEERQPVDVFEAIQGAAPGVRVTSDSGAPGEESDIIIRGISTLSDEGVKPLYVVDGVPMSSIASINPEDIQSIDILKDGASAAIYGSRSANGVVIITTKSGDEGRPTVSLSYLRVFNSLANRVPQANRLERQIFDRNNVLYHLGLDPRLPDSTSFVRNADNDYQDLITRTGMRNQLSFSISGGNDQLKYYNNISYLGLEGIVLNSYSNRLTTRTNFTYKPSSKVSLLTRLNFAYKKGNYINEGQVIQQALQRPPQFTLYFPDGNFMYDNLGRRNPVAEALLRQDTRTDYQAVLYQSMDYQISEPLQFHVDVSADLQLVRRTTFNPQALSIGTDPISTGIDNTNIPIRTIGNAYFRYRKRFNRVHLLNVVAGLNAEKNKNDLINLEGRRFVTEAVQTLNAAGEFVLNNLYTRGGNSSLLGFYARAEYNYKGKYMLNGIIRRDGSSVFGRENRWGNFPSLSAGWRVSREPFMEWAKPVLSDAKIRGSWGITGNQAIGDFDALQQFNFGSYFYNGVSGVRTDPRLGNNMLQWEETEQANIGLDLSFLKGRVSVVADYYVKNTTDLLYNMRLPLEIGYTSGARMNLGAIQNKGVELMVTGNVIQSKKMHWQTSFNWTRIRNKITHLPDGDYIANGIWYVGEGMETGNFYGYKYLGVYQYDESNAYTEDYRTRLTPHFEKDAEGNVIFGKDLVPILIGYTYPDGTPYEGTVHQMTANGVVSRAGDVIWENLPDADGNLDGNIGTEDRQIIGYGQPRWMIGWSNTFSYRQFSLSFNLYGSFGHSVYNEAMRFRTSFVGGNLTPEPYYIYNMHKYPGQITDAYRGRNTEADNSRRGGSYFLEDGSFIRLQAVRLTYELPQKWIETARIKKLDCYVYGNNLLRWTNYTGFDPEVGQRNVLTPGNDTGRYPRGQQIGFGVRASL